MPLQLHSVFMLVASVLLAIIASLSQARTTTNNIINDGDESKYVNCGQVRDVGYKQNGLYRLHIGGTFQNIHCRFENGVGMSTILKRQWNDVSFNRSYEDYKQLFGDPRTTFWLGLETIHHMSQTGNIGLRVKFADWDNHFETMEYGVFQVGDEASGYALTIGGYYGTKGSDMLGFLNGAKFYAPGHPDPKGCAEGMSAGFWYNTADNMCTKALPSGHYYIGGWYQRTGPMWNGIFWMSHLGMNYSLRNMELILLIY